MPAIEKSRHRPVDPVTRFGRRSDVHNHKFFRPAQQPVEYLSQSHQ